ncbi:MAG: DUF4855 domain-containing protein [Armatimonadota bacterium]
MKLAATAVLMLAFCAIVISLTPVPSKADYLTPEKAGFHHCVLIYHTEKRDANALKPYVVRMRNGQPTNDWLFDSFVFLDYSLPSGRDTEAGATNMQDWLWQLDSWFAKNRDIDALNQAISQTSAVIGTKPKARKVILSIPWSNPAVTDFGDVDGDGVSESLASLAGREKVMRWYVKEAMTRFQQARYEHLELWGFYWMRERIDVNPETVRAASRVVHEAGSKLLWIPWFRSPGWQNAYNYGFDAVIMQPNYSFNTWLDGGNVRSNRLDICAMDCMDKGFGVEIENRSNPPNYTDGQVFLNYLAYGDAKRLGYQKAVNGYFMDALYLENTYSSGNTEAIRYYEALADYVTGKTIPVPIDTVKLAWSKSGAVYAGVGKVDPLHKVCYVDVITSRERLSGWRGVIEAQFKRGGKYCPAGWAAYLQTSTDKVGSLPIPVDGGGENLRLKVTTLSGTFRPDAIIRASLDSTGPHAEPNMALFKPYTISPDTTPRDYPDSGGKLTDGVVDLQGFHSGLSVGWMSTRVQVQLDLGRKCLLTGVDLHLLGGGNAGVNWPKQVDAAFSAEVAVRGDFAGLGQTPGGLVVVSNKAVSGITRRSPKDASGVISLRTKKAITARYITVAIEPDIWLMLSELRVKGKQGNIAVKSYRVTPRPTAQPGGQYVDDGRKLTDGVDYEALNSGLVGWTGKGTREITFDLGSIRSTQSFSVYVLSDLYSSRTMAAPAKVEFVVSPDGQQWSSPLPAAKQPQINQNSLFEYSEYRAICPDGASARYVRAVITPSGEERTLVSEIAVR